MCVLVLYVAEAAWAATCANRSAATILVKSVLIHLFCASVAIANATEPQALGDRYNILVRGFAQTGPTSEQYDAFRYLVDQGPEGWKFLFQAQCDTGIAGDAVRQIDSFWETSGLSADLLDRFSHAQRAEIARRASNETWALLYAGAYVRTAHAARNEVKFERLNRHFERLRLLLDRPAEALIEVAFLRVMLVGAKTFPGHTFRWTAPPDEQRKELEELHAWWKAHEDDYKRTDAESGPRD